MRIQCLAHSDINKFKYGRIISITKDTVYVKFDGTDKVIEYPKFYLGKELEIINDNEQGGQR